MRTVSIAFEVGGPVGTDPERRTGHEPQCEPPSSSRRGRHREERGVSTEIGRELLLGAEGEPTGRRVTPSAPTTTSNRAVRRARRSTSTPSGVLREPGDAVTESEVEQARGRVGGRMQPVRARHRSSHHDRSRSRRPRLRRRPPSTCGRTPGPAVDVATGPVREAAGLDSGHRVPCASATSRLATAEIDGLASRPGRRRALHDGRGHAVADELERERETCDAAARDQDAWGVLNRHEVPPVLYKRLTHMSNRRLRRCLARTYEFGVYDERMGNREDLFAGARQVILERGVAKATAREIANAAGVSLAAIGYHFGSKDELHHSRADRIARQRHRRRDGVDRRRDRVAAAAWRASPRS